MNKTIKNSLFYASGLCAIVLLGKLAGFNDIFTIGITGGLSLIVALILRNTKAFNKTDVDLIYYSMAILGVIVYFWQEMEVRDVKAVDENITRLERTLGEARIAVSTFDEMTVKLQGLTIERNQIAAEIRANPENILTAIREAEINAKVRMSTAEALVCAEASGLQVIYPTNTLESQNQLPGQGLRNTLRREQALKACNSFSEDLKRRKELATTNRISLNDLIDSPARFDNVSNDRVNVNGQSLPISVVIDILRGRDPLDRRAEQRRSFVSDVDAAYKALNTARENRDEDISVAEKGAPYFVWFLRYQGWPIVLILLLSLKLARSRKQ